MKTFFIILFLSVITFLNAQCIDLKAPPASNEVDKVLSLADTVYNFDWNADGIIDKIALTKQGGNCVKLIFVYYGKKNEIIGIEQSQRLNEGTSDCCPTSITMKKNVVIFKSQQMRNELQLKFRFDSKNMKTLLIGKDVEYYPSGGYGTSIVSVNYLTKKKTISTQTPNLQDQKSEYNNKSIEKNITHTAVSLSDIRFDTMYDDLDN